MRSGVESIPRSGWDEWRIWLKLASKQRRHLDHNERSECSCKHIRMKKAKRMRSIFLKGFGKREIVCYISFMCSSILSLYSNGSFFQFLLNETNQPNQIERDRRIKIGCIKINKKIVVPNQ